MRNEKPFTLKSNDHFKVYHAKDWWGDESKNDIKEYEMDIWTTLDELFDICEATGYNPLIIDFKRKQVIIYDDYIE